MKMENVLRADRDLVVSKINAAAGESLAVDAVHHGIRLRDKPGGRLHIGPACRPCQAQPDKQLGTDKISREISRWTFAPPLPFRQENRWK
jgi:hypothetical protein